MILVAILTVIQFSLLFCSHITNKTSLEPVFCQRYISTMLNITLPESAMFAAILQLTYQHYNSFLRA